MHWDTPFLTTQRSFQSENSLIGERKNRAAENYASALTAPVGLRRLSYGRKENVVRSHGILAAIFKHLHVVAGEEEREEREDRGGEQESSLV